MFKQHITTRGRNFGVGYGKEWIPVNITRDVKDPIPTCPWTMLGTSFFTTSFIVMFTMSRIPTEKLATTYCRYFNFFHDTWKIIHVYWRNIKRQGTLLKNVGDTGHLKKNITRKKK